MAAMRPKQMARQGEFLLEEAILDVLMDNASKDNAYLGPRDISLKAGIFREPGKGVDGNVKSGNDFIVQGMLIKLFIEKKVERGLQAKGKDNGWRLTKSEIKRRQED